MFGRLRQDTDLDRELRGFVELLVEEKVRAGMSPDAARRAALIETGGVEQVKERVRDVRRSAALEILMQDVRYAARSLRQSPAFAIAAVLTLAIGIGANTAIFSAVDGVLFKPLPFSRAERIVALYENDRKAGVERADVAPGNFADWRARSTSFDAMAAAEPFSLPYDGPEGRELLGNWNVTEDFFAVLDARPVIGRLLVRDDFQPGRPHVAVISFDSWQQRFRGDPATIGKVLRLANDVTTIVGVLPRDFAYLGNLKRYELFTPKVLDTMEVNYRRQGWYHVVGRMKAGVDVGQAGSDLNRVAALLEREYPRTNTSSYVTVVPLLDGMVGSSARTLLLLLGGVAFVLLIACTNVANLSLARIAQRAREFAVRVALGAGPRRIARQVLTESFLVALAGGTVGVAIAYWGVGFIRALSPASLPRTSEIRVDGRALAFTMAIVVATTFIFGLVPALRAASTTALQDLKGGARSGSSAAHGRLRAVLVSAQVAFAVVLLVGAGLLMRSFVGVVGAERGYRTDDVLTGTAFIWQWNPTAQSRDIFVQRLTERLRAIPGVEAAGVTTSLPLQASIGADDATFTIDGQPVAEGQEPSAHMASLTPGAFDALRMELRRGRWFSASDDSASVPVAIVSESFARRYWPDRDPIGQRVRFGHYGPPVLREVVGVVADIRQNALDAPAEPTLYLPYAQGRSGSITIVLRASRAAQDMTRALKAAVAQVNPQIPVTAIHTLDEVVSGSLRARRFILALFGCFAVAALILAIVGVYGVMSHSTVERSREFGVRMALGAQRRDIVSMVLAQGLTSAGAGLVIGCAAAGVLSRLLVGMLFGVTPLDATTFSLVAFVMLCTAAVACYIPARRATRVHPVTALRVG